MKKYGIVLALTTALVVSSGGAQTQPVQVSFVYGLGGELGKAIEVMIKDFNDSQKEVVVKGEFANTYEGVLQKALAGVAAGQPAGDILQLEVALWPRLAAAGQLVDLSSQDGFKDTFNSFWPVFRRQTDPDGDGKVYAMPWNNSNPVMYYNPELLAKAGLKVPPRTWPELREAAKKIKAATGQPAVRMESFPWVLEGALFSNNAEMIKNGKLALTDPKALEVINTWVGFFKDGTAVVANPATQADFVTGKVAIMFGSVASRPGLKNTAKFKFGTAPLPYFKKPLVPVGGATLAISQNIPIERQKAAWKFMRWLAQPEQQFKFIKMSNYVPITRSTLDLPAYKQYIGTEQGLDLGGRQLNFARPRPYHPAYPQVTQEIIKTMEAMYLQNAPVEASVRDLVDRMNPLMEAAVKR